MAGIQRPLRRPRQRQPVVLSADAATHRWRAASSSATSSTATAETWATGKAAEFGDGDLVPGPRDRRAAAPCRLQRATRRRGRPTCPPPRPHRQRPVQVGQQRFGIQALQGEIAVEAQAAPLRSHRSGQRARPEPPGQLHRHRRRGRTVELGHCNAKVGQVQRATGCAPPLRTSSAPLDRLSDRCAPAAAVRRLLNRPLVAAARCRRPRAGPAARVAADESPACPGAGCGSTRNRWPDRR